jgi:hypothetical protein
MRTTARAAMMMMMICYRVCSCKTHRETAAATAPRPIASASKPVQPKTLLK